MFSNYILISIFIIINTACYTKLPYQDNPPDRAINKKRDDSTKCIILINGKYSFSFEKEDHSQGYKYPKGNYYKFDFKNQSYKWTSVREQLCELSQKNIEIIDAWYQGESSSCTDIITGTSFPMMVNRKFLIRLENPNMDLLKLGYIRTKKLLFLCPFHPISHYSKNNKQLNKTTRESEKKNPNYIEWSH